MSINNSSKLLNIIDKFNDDNMNSINYKTKFSKRNKLSINHTEFVEYFIRLFKPSNFLELHINQPEYTNKLINLIPGPYYFVNDYINENVLYLLNNYKNLNYYNGSNNDYFNHLSLNNLNLKLDMAFIYNLIDYNEFLTITNHLNNDGVIFIQYFNPNIIENIKKYNMNEYEFLNIFINPGLLIIKKL